MRLNRCASLAVVLSVAVAAPAATPAIYNLGTLGGGGSSWGGVDINASGQVLVNSNIFLTIYDDPSDLFYPYYPVIPTADFLYTGTPGSGGVMQNLGGADVITAMNDSGQFAGYGSWDGVNYYAYLYTGTPGSGGVVQYLGTLGAAGSVANAINDSGQVTGGSDSLPTTEFHAFLYTGTPGSGGVMHDLGTLGGWQSEGLDINASGDIAGWSRTSTATTIRHAFLYTGTPGNDGVMHDLGTLGGTGSVGLGINDSRQVVGWSNTAADAAFHAFLYTGTPGSGGLMHDLGTLGGNMSVGEDINASGQVVGWSRIEGDAIRAFLYTGTPGVDGMMIDLDAWLDANNPTEGAHWTLEHASALNDNGLITGRGYYDDGPGGLSDGTRAFLLDASSLLSEPPGLPGDYNHDGTVDAADYIVWRKTDGTPAGYNTWRANFGQTTGSGTGATSSASAPAVPEPSSLALLTVAAALLLLPRPEVAAKNRC